MSKEKSPLAVAHYMALPYTVVLRPDEDGDVVARIAELPGCAAHGKTQAAALENLQEAQRLWIQDAIEAGDAVPVPEKEEEVLPSGKWVQRVPRTLHQRLAQLAKKENVSLNQLVTSMLSESLAGRNVATLASQNFVIHGQQPPLSNIGVHVHDVWDRFLSPLEVVWCGDPGDQKTKGSLLPSLEILKQLTPAGAISGERSLKTKHAINPQKPARFYQ